MEKTLPIIKVENLKFGYGKSEILALKGHFIRNQSRRIHSHSRPEWIREKHFG